jgi:hypothetical protein
LVVGDVLLRDKTEVDIAPPTSVLLRDKCGIYLDIIDVLGDGIHPGQHNATADCLQLFVRQLTHCSLPDKLGLLDVVVDVVILRGEIEVDIAIPAMIFLISIVVIYREAIDPLGDPAWHPI